jgi:DNA-binding MarR family transcriptional regulator
VYFAIEMSIQANMVNENYEPSKNDELILEVLKDGRNRDEPWGRANPRYLIDQTGLEKSNVEFSLRSLRSAGWVERAARGLYELVEDPRDERD